MRRLRDSLCLDADDPVLLFGHPPRDPARIDRVLAAVRAAWLQQPDSRLGQLLFNTARLYNTSDLFYVEDDFWLRALTEETTDAR